MHPIGFCAGFLRHVMLFPLIPLVPLIPPLPLSLFTDSSFSFPLRPATRPPIRLKRSRSRDAEKSKLFISMETIRCKIERILFPRGNQAQPENGYAIVAASAKKNDKNDIFSAKDEIMMKGPMPGVHVGADVTVGGEWKTDRYGRTFVVTSYEENMPTSLEGIRNYLSSGLIRGIGPSLAYLIVEKFGEKTLDILDDDPQRLREVSGIGRKKLDSIIEAWSEQKGIRDVMIFLKQYDVTNALAAKIYKKYKDESIHVMKTDPYRLADEIDGVGFLTSDKVALSMGVSRGDESRLKAGVKFVLKENAEKKGNVYCHRNDLVKETLKLLNNEVAGDAAVPAKDLEDLISRMDKELSRDGENGERIYLPVFRGVEDAVARRLGVMAVRDGGKDSSVDFGKVEAKCGVSFDDIQKDAIELADRSSVCVITGGPGTGKTTTMRGVIAAAESRREKVLLAAPTGRAAKRLAETAGKEAKTIHRLLEYSPEGFQRDEDNPLEGDLLVIDESSMLDLMLMNSLLKAIPPHMRTVFVGDVDQLPSVGAGTILRDIIGSGVIPVVRLTRIFRQAQGSLIVANAHAINQGRQPVMQTNLSPDAGDFCFIERSDEQRVVEDIRTLVSSYIPETFDVRRSDIQVLSPMRKGLLGTVSLNRILQEKLNAGSQGLRRGETEFRVGDRVMVTKNNYELDVFNGDIGKVTSVDMEDRSLKVDFGDGDVLMSGADLDDLDLAYCTTIHKSQGSEYPVVIVPVVSSHYVMLMRNLLYTAVTRAKTLCVLVGEKRAVDIMVNNNAILKRNSALAEKLGRLVGK